LGCTSSFSRVKLKAKNWDKWRSIGKMLGTQCEFDENTIRTTEIQHPHPP